MPLFSSRYSLLLLLPLIAFSILVSIYFYRNFFSASKLKKYFLIAIKSLGIFFLLNLLIEPAFSFLGISKDGMMDIIFVDNSRSVQTDSESVKNFFSLVNKNNFKIFTFGNSSNGFSNTEELPNLKFNDFETDISSALNLFQQNYASDNLRGITILSDGNFNKNSNPVYKLKEFGCPVFTVGVGDTTEKKDVCILDVINNPKAFIGINTKIKILIKSFGYDGQSSQVDLQRDGNTIHSETITLRNGIQESEFNLSEQQRGVVHYKISVKPLDAEVTLKNNYHHTAIEFIDNKVKLLFLSGGPSYDNALITEILKRIKNFETTTRTSKNGNEFYEGSLDTRTLGTYSVIFMLNFPLQSLNTELFSSISQQIIENKIPLIFFAGKNTDYQKLSSLEQALPFSISHSNSSEDLVNLRYVSGNEMFKDISSKLQSSTQIFKNVTGINQKPGAVSVFIDSKNSEPVFIKREGEQKSSAFMCYGLWRLKLNKDNNIEKILEQFLVETISTTLKKDEDKNFVLYPSKFIFDYTENPILFAEVYGENKTFLTNAKVKANIINQLKSFSQIYELKLTENKYSSALQTLSADKYLADAEAELPSRNFEKASTGFLIDTLTTEFKETKSDFSVLKSISSSTDGSFFSLNENEKFLEAKLKHETKRRQSTLNKINFNLWQNKFILMLIIFLFAVEWVLRKRNNLP